MQIIFTRNHFRPDLPPDEARELFKASVRYVEVEPFSFCNRKCHFCPNATLPYRQDRKNNQFMEESMFLRIFDELASIGYAGQVQLGRYEEPLADRVILTRIRQIRERLPGGWVYLHTNGDYLTRDYLNDLKDAGLSEVALQTYLGNDQRWHEQAILDQQSNQLRRLGLRVKRPITAAPGLRHYHETDYPGMVVRVDARNFDAIGTDRGGLLPIRQTPRTAPCLIPFSSLYVDWTGSTVPCCNIRTDLQPELTVCRLQDGHSIFDAFAALHGWRLSLLRFGEKSGPCATCRYDEDAVPKSQAGELERIYAAAVH